MAELRFQCQKCRRSYALGHDALVVTTLGVMGDFAGSAVLGTGRSLVENRADPDLVRALGAGWYSLDTATRSEQEAEINRLSSLLSRGPRWWRCTACGETQIYRLL